MLTPPRLVAALLLILAIVLLSGCDGTGAAASGAPGGGNSYDPCNYHFENLIPSDWQILRATPLPPTVANDPNDDQACGVIYAYDTPPKGSFPIGPERVVIFRRDRNRPMDLHAYPVSFPDNRYEGEHNRMSVTMQDVISGLPGYEVVINDIDEHGITVTTSIFKWKGQELSEESWYDAVGSFSGDGGVDIAMDVVTVTQRIPGTRSQLARRAVYRPKDKKSYYQEPPLVKNAPGITPVQSETKIPYIVSLTMPADPATSEYPEKALLAFYQQMPITGTASFTRLKRLVGPDDPAVWWRKYSANVPNRPNLGCLGQPNISSAYVITLPQDAEMTPVPPHTESLSSITAAKIRADAMCLQKGRSIPATTVWYACWQRNPDRWYLTLDPCPEKK